MLSRHTLSPNVHIIRPEVGLDRKHLKSCDLEFTLSELPIILIVDLRATREIDSDGLAWLVNLQIVMAEQGKTLLLLKPSSEVKALLRRAGIEDLFWMAPSLKKIHEILLPIHPELFSTSIVLGH